MQDVIEKPRTVGPVDAIKSMDLTDFRHLSPQPVTAMDKIKKRFELLREEGVDRYMDGVKAWRESPLYGVYVQMLHEGLLEGRELTELVAAGTDDPQRFNKDELSAIIELNKSLRF